MPRPLDQYFDVIPKADLRLLEPALRNLQANILTGFERDHAGYAFLRFGETDPTEALRSLKDDITSAWMQLLPRPEQPRAMMSIGLSITGFQKLGLCPGIFWQSFNKGFGSLLRERLGQPLEGWERPFSPERRVDAVVIVAADELGDVWALKRRVDESFEGVASIDWQAGYVERRGKFSIEHFGFVDGISQPIFLEHELEGDGYSAGALPNASTRLVLGRDPWPWSSPCDFGSYLVFLKLEQDKTGFDKTATALATALNRGQPPSAADIDRAKSLIIGRTPAGLPLEDPSVTGLNNFDFSSDPRGLRCPRGAHIRKLNPRRKEDAFRRIARRGTLYREGEKVGMLFQCYQYDLCSQFEELFVTWGNGRDQPEAGAGVDPLIGRRQAGSGSPQCWPTAEGSDLIGFDIGSLVTVRGGEYFYVPSIRFFAFE